MKEVWREIIENLPVYSIFILSFWFVALLILLAGVIYIRG